jgi:hypothetical protein
MLLALNTFVSCFQDNFADVEDDNYDEPAMLARKDGGHVRTDPSDPVRSSRFASAALLPSSDGGH